MVIGSEKRKQRPDGDENERDRVAIFASAFARATATGLIGVELGLYLSHLQLSPAEIGFIIAAGLLGAAFAALVVTLLGDRLGRRRTLAVLSILGAAGALVAASGSSPLVVGAAAFVGMLNGMGRDRGASLILEQAILPGTTTPAQRTGAIAWYNVLQDIGHAIGSLLAGLPSLAVAWSGGGAGDALLSHRWTMALAAVLTLAPLAAIARMTPRVEIAHEDRHARLSPQSRRILVRICALFAVDSLAGGLLVTSLLAYFFFERFEASEGAIAALFFGARILNALSHFGAAWLARRIGLVNTMVFTHIPSSILLMTVAVAPSFEVAAVLFLLREGLVEMDVPTRQSYVLAVVRPQERTFASGVTSLVRLGAWAVAPTMAGLFMQSGSLMMPLVVGAAMKIAYDLLLWRAFREVVPPEEQSA